MKVEERHWRRWRPVWIGYCKDPVHGSRPSRSRGRRWTAAASAVVVIVGVGWLVTNHLQRPTERVYTPEADTYVTTAHPNANFGTATILRSDSTPKIRSYLRFRLHSLSGKVVSARLRLWSRTGDLVGYSVHPVTKAGWDELRISSNNGPAAGKPVASSGPFGPETWSGVDVTRLVQGTDAVSLALTTNSTQNVTFDSRESIHKPQLVVQIGTR
jgi:hypothetical protein